MVLGYGGEEGEGDIEPEEDTDGWYEPGAGGGEAIFLDVADELGTEVSVIGGWRMVEGLRLRY